MKALLYQLSYICEYGAGNRLRTRDPLITSQALYQLSYTSVCCLGRDRTCDRMINSHLLYQLSY